MCDNPQDRVCGCRMLGQNEHYLRKLRARTPAKYRMYYDHRGNENNSDKSAGDILRSAYTWNGGDVRNTDDSVSPTMIRSEKLRYKA